MKRWIALSPLVFLLSGVLMLVLAGNGFAQDAAPAEAPAAEVVVAEVEADPAAPPAGNAISYAVDSVFMLIFAVLVLFMQAGFALVEVGLNSQKNTVNILFKNVMDLCIGVLLFWWFGFNLMYPGKNVVNGWLPKFPAFQVDRPSEPDLAYGLSTSTDFMFQVAFAATAATIVSGAVAGRMKFVSYLIYSAVITGLIYPISGYWKWGGGVLQQMGFQDFAGSIIVHAVGGFAGLAGAIALGPRIGRFKDGKSTPIPGHNLTFACLGVFILLCGWFGFNPGSQLHYATAPNAEATTYIAMTTILAAAAGGNVAMLICWAKFGKPDLTMALNGILGGLVSITANCDRVSQGDAVLIGAIGGGVVVAAILALEKLQIDDPVGAFPVHGACGLWGGLATGLFGSFEGVLKTVDGAEVPVASRAEFFMIELKSSFIVIGWAFGTMLILFYGLKAIGLLRVTAEEEIEGLDIGEHGMQAYVNT